MEGTSLDHYEEQLYSVFKTFDVDNSETLSHDAAEALCEALQLGARGAALVAALFERRARVTFTQFRGGLLAALGATGTPHDSRSDDDSSGREVAPKFIFGSKKYGRRSRPPSAAGDPAVPGPAAPAASPTATEPAEIDHQTRIDCHRALQLCRQLHMDGIDRTIVEKVFQGMTETTVGDFFDRLNDCLSSSIAATCDVAGAASCREHLDDSLLPISIIVEAFEQADIQQPHELLSELGFGATAMVPAAALERALEDELGAHPEPRALRTALRQAALAFSRLRLRRAHHRISGVVTERDRLRHDLAEANKRARILALEVDESHARLEAELNTEMKKNESRHIDAVRALQEEHAAERERAAAERALLEADVARRAEREARLLAEAVSLRDAVGVMEARSDASEERTAAAERAVARLTGQLQEVERAAEAARAAAEDAARTARDEQLRAENAALRDRVDELCAALDARPPRDRDEAAPPPPASWRDETSRIADPLSSLGSVASEPVKLEAAETDSGDEARRLTDLVKELEWSLEQMREEYERCEEYWSGKLREERALQHEELRASDERLAALAARVRDFERRAALPPIAESALELQVNQLQEEFARHRRRAAAALRARDSALRRLAAPAPAPSPGPHAAGGALAARAARAEGCAARLAARLAAADRLVHELYVENCLLAARAPP